MKQRPLEFRIRCNSGDKPWHYFDFPTAYLEMDLWFYDLESQGQFTGLFVASGKKLFEGDIVRAWNKGEVARVYEIVYDQGAFWLSGPSGKSDGGLACHKHKEIIGNIYENPELIKSES